MLLLTQNCRFCGLVKWAPEGSNVKVLVPSCGRCWQAEKPQEVELSGVEVGQRDITFEWKTRPQSLSFLLPGCHEASSFLRHTTVAWRAAPIINGFSVWCMMGCTNHQGLLSLVYDNLSLHSLISVLTAHPHGILIPSCGLYLSRLQGYPQSSSVFIASSTQKPRRLHCSLSWY